jgi:hypothetical protein
MFGPGHDVVTMELGVFEVSHEPFDTHESSSEHTKAKATPITITIPIPIPTYRS